MKDKIRIVESTTLNVDARDLVAALDVPRWVEAVDAGRPFENHAALHDAVMTAAAPFGAEEIDRALGHHPRIGDRPSGTSIEQQHARAEQSGVDTSDDDIKERIRAGNMAYEARFGRVFLIRAAGRSAQDVLDALDQRMTNDAVTELAVIESELRAIAALRLGATT